jgi:hypothetical protein
MAKVHINKALQLNPKDELALKGKRHLEGLAQKNNTVESKQLLPSQSQANRLIKSNGGLFGKMFGPKKK